ncbi:MAG TPA: hypothetical protein VIP11_26645, partial [Gemmatimonadaceae bacterium]
MRFSKIVLVALGTIWSSGFVAAQTPDDASVRLKQALPPAVANRVLAVIARARSHDLPADALENRALKFAAKGVQPDAIEKSVVEHEARMQSGKDAIERARGTKPTGEEVEAAAEVIRKGMDGARVSDLAKSAPSGRSLAVPLYVLGGLLDRGLSSDDAMQRVVEKLRARASDRDLEQMQSDLSSGSNNARGNRPAESGRDISETKRGNG